ADDVNHRDVVPGTGEVHPEHSANRARAPDETAHCLIRGASPLGLPDTLSRSPRRRLAPFPWLARAALSHVASTTRREGAPRQRSDLGFRSCATRTPGPTVL